MSFPWIAPSIIKITITGPLGDFIQDPPATVAPMDAWERDLVGPAVLADHTYGTWWTFRGLDEGFLKLSIISTNDAYAGYLVYDTTSNTDRTLMHQFDDAGGFTVALDKLYFVFGIASRPDAFIVLRANGIASYALAPVIIKDPDDAIVEEHHSVSFVSAGGGRPEPTIQWQRHEG